MNGFPPPVDHYIRILPELVLTLFGIIVMVVDPLLPAGKSRKPLAIISFIGALAAFVATYFQQGYYGYAFSAMIRVDAFSIFFHYVVAGVAAVVILASFEYLEVQ